MNGCKLVMTVDEMKDRQKWLEMRNKGIGGSDAGIIAGLSPFKSPFTLWLEKTGKAEPEDLSQNEAVHWGTVLEPLVADWFTEETGKKVRKCGMMVRAKEPWLFANVDRLVVGEKAGLEIKTASQYSKSKWDGDKVPDSYYLQCQHYMMVTGLEKWYIACLIGGQHPVWKTIPRNEQDIKLLYEAEKDFWERNVLGGEMPPVDGTTGCQEALQQQFRGGIKEPTEMLEAADALKNYDAAKEDYDASKLRFEAAKNDLCRIMGDHEVGTCYGRKFTWKVQTSERVDSRKLREKYPNVWNDVKKESSSRILRVSKREDE